MRKPIRKLRHWKQRYNPNASFIWRRKVTWNGKPCIPGGSIPDGLAADKSKLRRLWESQWIELAEFEAPNVQTGQVETNGGTGTALPAGVVVEGIGGPWHIVRLPDGTETKVRGKEALRDLLSRLKTSD